MHVEQTKKKPSDFKKVKMQRIGLHLTKFYTLKPNIVNGVCLKEMCVISR